MELGNFDELYLLSDCISDFCKFNDSSIFDIAKSCAEGEDIEMCWGDLLSRMLNHWKAEVQMDLNDAISICLYATGIKEEDSFVPCHFNSIDSPHCIQNMKFWYCDKSPIRAMKIYRITVALFESINYWCWHDAPLPITFCLSELVNCLNSPICLEWEKYDGFLDDWNQNIIK